MKQIIVLGSGCRKCNDTAAAIAAIVKQLEVSATVTKETDPEAIMNYSVMSTPAVVIDDVVVHSGSKPTDNEITAWFKSA